MVRMRLALLSVALVVASIAAADDASLNSAPRSIDVIVTDRGGTRIAGLSESDFQIYEDGQLRNTAKFTPRFG